MSFPDNLTPLTAFAVQELIDAAMLAQPLIQRGFDSIPFANQPASSKQIFYPIEFGGRPEVVILPYGTSVYFATGSTTPGAASFVAQMRRYDNTAATVNIPFSWIAIGPRKP